MMNCGLAPCDQTILWGKHRASKRAVIDIVRIVPSKTERGDGALGTRHRVRVAALRMMGTYRLRPCGYRLIAEISASVSGMYSKY